MRPKIVFVDVDDTLVRSVGAKRIPIPETIKKVRGIKAEGYSLFLWSSGGAEYARASADELGISHCFDGYLPKPTAYIDDQPVNEWRFCKHVDPAQADRINASTDGADS
ncbi:MAG: hypothetical protein ACK4E7_01775 [Permianibacter sp.]